MSKSLVNTQILSDTADAIRNKSGETGGIRPVDFAEKIENIPGDDPIWHLDGVMSEAEVHNQEELRFTADVSEDTSPENVDFSVSKSGGAYSSSILQQSMSEAADSNGLFHAHVNYNGVAIDVPYPTPWDSLTLTNGYQTGSVTSAYPFLGSWDEEDYTFYKSLGIKYATNSSATTYNTISGDLYKFTGEKTFFTNDVFVAPTRVITAGTTMINAPEGMLMFGNGYTFVHDVEGGNKIWQGPTAANTKPDFFDPSDTYQYDVTFDWSSGQYLVTIPSTTSDSLISIQDDSDVVKFTIIAGAAANEKNWGVYIWVRDGETLGDALAALRGNHTSMVLSQSWANYEQIWSQSSAVSEALTSAEIVKNGENVFTCDGGYLMSGFERASISWLGQKTIDTSLYPKKGLIRVERFDEETGEPKIVDYPALAGPDDDFPKNVLREW